MSGKHFGAAVAVAALLTGLPIAPTGFPIAPGDIEGASRWRTAISETLGWDPFGASKGVLVVDLNEALDVNGADVPRNIRSFPPKYDPVSGSYANIPLTAGSNVLSDPSAVDPLFLQSLLDEVNSNIDTGKSSDSRPVANASARPSASTAAMRPAISSRAPTRRSRVATTLRPQGCARCGGQVVQASAGRSKLFAALFSRTFSGKGGSVRPRHPAVGIGREREGALLAASTIPRGWRDPAL